MGAEIPMFSSLSQQPTVRNSSTRENGLTEWQSIPWYYLLVCKKWRWSKIHRLEITHISVPTAGNPMFSQISQQPTVGNFSIHENGPTRCQSIHWHYIWQLECRIH